MMTFGWPCSSEISIQEGSSCVGVFKVRSHLPRKGFIEDCALRVETGINAISKESMTARLLTMASPTRTRTSGLNLMRTIVSSWIPTWDSPLRLLLAAHWEIAVLMSHPLYRGRDSVVAANTSRVTPDGIWADR